MAQWEEDQRSPAVVELGAQSGKGEQKGMEGNDRLVTTYYERRRTLSGLRSG